MSLMAQARCDRLAASTGQRRPIKPAPRADGPDSASGWHGMAQPRAMVMGLRSRLDRSGATLKTAMQLARHSDPKLTAKRYGRAQLHDLAGAVEKLPSLLGSAPTVEAIRATGTDDSGPVRLARALHTLPIANERARAPMRKLPGSQVTPDYPHRFCRVIRSVCERMRAIATRLTQAMVDGVGWVLGRSGRERSTDQVHSRHDAERRCAAIGLATGHAGEDRRGRGDGGATYGNDVEIDHVFAFFHDGRQRRRCGIRILGGDDPDHLLRCGADSLGGESRFVLDRLGP